MTETLEEISAAVYRSVERRRLMVMPVDGHGNETHWNDPAAIGIRFMGPGYFYRLPAVVSQVCGKVDPGIVAELETIIFAEGRRHAMKGEFDD